MLLIPVHESVCYNIITLLACKTPGGGRENSYFTSQSQKKKEKIKTESFASCWRREIEGEEQPGGAGMGIWGPESEGIFS